MITGLERRRASQLDVTSSCGAVTRSFFVEVERQQTGGPIAGYKVFEVKREIYVEGEEPSAVLDIACACLCGLPPRVFETDEETISHYFAARAGRSNIPCACAVAVYELSHPSFPDGWKADINRGVMLDYIRGAYSGDDVPVSLNVLLTPRSTDAGGSRT